MLRVAIAALVAQLWLLAAVPRATLSSDVDSVLDWEVGEPGRTPEERRQGTAYVACLIVTLPSPLNCNNAVEEAPYPRPGTQVLSKALVAKRQPFHNLLLFRCG